MPCSMYWNIIRWTIIKGTYIVKYSIYNLYYFWVSWNQLSLWNNHTCYQLPRNLWIKARFLHFINKIYEHEMRMDSSCEREKIEIKVSRKLLNKIRLQACLCACMLEFKVNYSTIFSIQKNKLPKLWFYLPWAVLSVWNPCSLYTFHQHLMPKQWCNCQAREEIGWCDPLHEVLFRNSIAKKCSNIIYVMNLWFRCSLYASFNWKLINLCMGSPFTTS